MSAWIPCSCGRKRGDHKDLVVQQRNRRCSAFDGYRVKWSPYSLVKCLRCEGLWRTKAAYVLGLPDEKRTE